jgi:hypothetical protein
MSALKTFWEVLRALPQILKLLKQLGDMVQEMKYNSNVKKIEKAHNKLEQAKTPEEKKDALKAITDTFKR